MSFLNIFAQSPFKPLQEHMDCVAKCVGHLSPFFKAVLAKDWDKVAKEQTNIAQLESKADEIKRHIRLQMPSGLFMPVSRTDILELLRGQDRIANRAKDFAGLITGRKMSIPSEIAKGMEAFLELNQAVMMQANEAVHELDELLETGFKGKEAKLVSDMINKLDHMEQEGDELQVKLRAELFQIESELPPVEVMFLYRIIELLADIGDCSQKVGHSLHLLLAN